MRISDWSSDVCSSDLLPFPVLAENLHRPPVHEPEIADVRWNINRTQSAHDPVECRCCAALCPAVARSVLPGSEDDVIALATFGDQFDDQFGRGLQIAVDRPESAAGGRKGGERGKRGVGGVM